jgi:hypothetical protein
MFSGWQDLRLVRLRTFWCPTGLGLFCLLLFLLVPTTWWFSYGESFLSLNWRLPAEVLVVEGWIGRVGVRAAATEYEQHRYQYVVATGNLSSDAWEVDQLSFADLTARELIRSGVPENEIIVAHPKETETKRTYQSAVAVWQALHIRGIQPKAMNVFTLGSHARRSRLTFAKVVGPETKVGVVAWVPPDYARNPWWRSSERAKSLTTETGGYVFEALLNSGRLSNSRN